MRWAVVVLLLAGCLGAPPASEPQPSQPAPTPAPAPDPAPLPDLPLLLAFDYRGCEGQLTHVPLSPSAAAAVLPEGHEAWTSDGLRPMAVAEYLWVRCQTFSTAQVRVNDTVYGHVAVRVEASGPAPGEHWYRLRMLTADDLMDAVWTAAGYDVYRGAFSTASDPGPQTVAVGEYEIQAIATVEESASSRQVTYHTALDDGRLEWRGQMEVDELTANGRLQVPADDAFASQIPALVSAWFVSGDFVGNDLWLMRVTGDG